MNFPTAQLYIRETFSNHESIVCSVRENWFFYDKVLVLYNADRPLLNVGSILESQPHLLMDRHLYLKAKVYKTKNISQTYVIDPKMYSNSFHSMATVVSSFTKVSFRF